MLARSDKKSQIAKPKKTFKQYLKYDSEICCSTSLEACGSKRNKFTFNI
jgi:hypothetical protein